MGLEEGGGGGGRERGERGGWGLRLLRAVCARVHEAVRCRLDGRRLTTWNDVTAPTSTLTHPEGRRTRSGV